MPEDKPKGPTSSFVWLVMAGFLALAAIAGVYFVLKP